jgi:hypothetical protein
MRKVAPRYAALEIKARVATPAPLLFSIAV